MARLVTARRMGALAMLVAMTTDGCTLDRSGWFDAPIGETFSDSSGVASSSTSTSTPTGSTTEDPEGNDPTSFGESSTGTTEAPSAIASSEASSAGSDESSSSSGDIPRDAELLESCAHALALDPTATSGIYSITPPAAMLSTPIEVYCDMTTDGGGWMLAGRSAGEVQFIPPFGWGSAQGSLEALDQPYSLDAIGTGVPFTEILVGDRGDAYDWGPHVYRLTLPENFLALTDSMARAIEITTIVGACSPPSGPQSLQFVGYVTRDDAFRFNNTGDDVNWMGLQERIWSTNAASNCERGGLIDQQRGMLFVR